jgi:hypothetical protein
MKAKQIDTDVPMPRGWSRDNSIYKLETLKSGSSFFTAFPHDDNKKLLRAMQRMHSSAYRLSKKHKCKIGVTTRGLEEQGVQGFRTWVVVNEHLDKK